MTTGDSKLPRVGDDEVLRLGKLGQLRHHAVISGVDPPPGAALDDSGGLVESEFFDSIDQAVRAKSSHFLAVAIPVGLNLRQEHRQCLIGGPASVQAGGGQEPLSPTVHHVVVALHDYLYSCQPLLFTCAPAGIEPGGPPKRSRLPSREASSRVSVTCRVPCVGSGSSNLSFRSEEHTSELQSRENLVCRLLLDKKKTDNDNE